MPNFIWEKTVKLDYQLSSKNIIEFSQIYRLHYKLKTKGTKIIVRIIIFFILFLILIRGVLEKYPIIQRRFPIGLSWIN